jgi:hypothetical protein
LQSILHSNRERLCRDAAPHLDLHHFSDLAQAGWLPIAFDLDQIRGSNGCYVDLEQGGSNMTRRIDHAKLLAREEIVSSPVPRACEDQGFELPPVIFQAMAGLFFGFLAVLTVGLAEPQLVVPMGVNFVFLTAFFAVPAVFVGATPGESRSLRWSEFMRKGIETATGHSSGREAAVLILVLPALIFFWALAIVTIVALV